MGRYACAGSIATLSSARRTSRRTGSSDTVPIAPRRPPPGAGEFSVTFTGLRCGQVKSRSTICAPATSMRAGGVTSRSTIIADWSSKTASRTSSVSAGAPGAPESVDGGDGDPAPAGPGGRSKSVRR
jgi:hypothetical protein